ncbi:NAD-P-binding protein [Lentinula detonsa]|uniref:NAD-P-binding protein n=1 Tax=Lentinula detonsa TaxID=2804962 RepID=A0AA38UT83_9AGAR|nr:NAD-P-binding protein [Lentinula detonsa]
MASEHSTPTTSLTGKIALVTGSSRGIGAAIAVGLAEQGADLKDFALDRTDIKAADQTVAKIKSMGRRAIAVQADTSTLCGGKSLLDVTVKEFGHIDILVLNAGMMGTHVMEDSDEAYFDAHFNTNVKGPFFLVKAAAKLFPESGGRVIFISSSMTIASQIIPEYTVYTMTKGAIEQMSRLLAKDLGTRSITVNTISPGPTDTELFRSGVSEDLMRYLASQNPNKRMARPDDVAPLVAFVASPAAYWINGANLRANGGYIV